MPVATVNPSPNPGSQLDRALWAYLHEIWPVTDTFPRPNFYITNDNRLRDTGTVGLLDIMSHDATEATTHTRNEYWTTRLNAEWPGANQPGQTDSTWNHHRINQFIGVVMAALSQTDNAGQDYRATCLKITAAGRRLAIFGNPECTGTAADIANNADMAAFNCDQLEYKGAQRAAPDREGGFFFGETRSFQFHVGNYADDSVYPALSYSGGSLNWTFTDNSPNQWLVEKSTDGLTWLTHATIAGALRTLSVSGTGLNYWRLFPADADGNQLDHIGESNTLQATA